MVATKTPGQEYLVVPGHQDERLWRVIPIPSEQARVMRDRGVKHIYGSGAQAYTVRGKLNEEEEKCRTHTSK